MTSSPRWITVAPSAPAEGSSDGAPPGFPGRAPGSRASHLGNFQTALPGRITPATTHLRAIAGLSYRDMARVLGISEEAVGSRLDRARQQLRTLLDEHGRRETKKKVSAEERRRILERLEVVRDASAVAREFRRNPNIPWRIARQAGIELTAGYAKRGYRTAAE